MMKRKEFYEVVKASNIGTRADVLEFIAKMEESDRKSRENSAFAREKRNAEYKELEKKIYDHMSTVGEPRKAMEWATDLKMSTQKLSPRLNAMALDGRVKREQIKREVFWSVL